MFKNIEKMMKMNRRIRRWLELGLFLLPAGLPLLVFWIYPIFSTFHLSFTDWDYMSPDYHVVGLANYLAMFREEAFYQALKTTLLFGIWTVVPTLALGFLMALLLQGLKKAGTFCKTLVFSPWITPVVAVSIVWTWIYEPDRGAANQLLAMLGITGLPWLHSSQTALLSVALTTVWKNIGYVMLFYIGALARVPKELYEAADVEGAGKGRILTDITLPMIAPTTLFLTVLLTIQSLQAYDQIQILTQGGPSGSTRTLLYRYYQLAFEQFDMGGAAATVTVLLVLTFLFSLIQFWWAGRYSGWEE